FVVIPGSGRRTTEGQAGWGSMLCNGAHVAEKIDVSANGTRVRFTRDVANIVMDTNGVEVIDFRALGGADAVTVHDLSGTDVTDESGRASCRASGAEQRGPGHVIGNRSAH